MRMLSETHEQGKTVRAWGFEAAENHPARMSKKNPACCPRNFWTEEALRLLRGPGAAGLTKHPGLHFRPMRLDVVE